MDADPTDAASRPSIAEDSKGLVVKATRRGSLVVETENARRMMRRFAELRPDPAPDSRTAGATP
jgi:hypothetical protein